MLSRSAPVLLPSHCGHSDREAQLEEQLAVAKQDAAEAEEMAQEAMTMLEAAQVGGCGGMVEGWRCGGGLPSRLKAACGGAWCAAGTTRVSLATYPKPASLSSRPRTGRDRNAAGGQDSSGTGAGGDQGAGG